MSDSLVATAGASNADSYNTLAELETYFTKYGLPAGWSALSDDVKCQAARQATRWMDGRWTWVGAVTDVATPQALAWPRYYALDRDRRWYGTNEIPPPIQRLHAEATRLAAEGKLQLSALDRGGAVQSESVGPISTSYFPGASPQSTYPYLDVIARPLVSGNGLRLVSNGG